jgi:hypothetical protein
LSRATVPGKVFDTPVIRRSGGTGGADPGPSEPNPMLTMPSAPFVGLAGYNWHIICMNYG